MRAPPVLLVVLLVLLAACSPPLVRDFCEVGLECSDPEQLDLDPVPGESEDSLEVCVVNNETTLAVLRANSEPECHDVADAREAFMACVIDEGCEALSREGPCGDEQDQVTRLIGETGNRCNE